MKYKPTFTCQSTDEFDLAYFNGHYSIVATPWSALKLMEANARNGERFNCVFTVVLIAPQAAIVADALSNSQHETLQTMADHLGLEKGTSVLKMNPQMTVLFVQELAKALRRKLSDLKLVFVTEMNWKGAELLAEACKSDYDPEVNAIGDRLTALMATLREKREAWQAQQDGQDESPRGYIPKRKLAAV